MRMRTLCAVLASTIFAAPALAQHEGDIFLGHDDVQLVTGGVSDGEILIPECVFLSFLGDSGFPGFTDDPGFDNGAGTFEPGTRIGFNVLDGLRVWTGDDFVIGSGQSMNISFLTAEVDVQDDPEPGFDIAVQPDGGWHRHLNYFLTLPGGGEATPGVYLLELEMYSTDPDLGSSEPLFLVFRHLVDDATHLDAAQWVADNLAWCTVAACPADFDGGGAVDAGDLAALLSSWGDCPDCPADLDGDDVVGASDLAALLSAWGACP